MFYSRRKLLRDSAVSCLAGAVATSVPLMAGCKADTQTNPKVAAAQVPADFGSGIRIFFIGAWLFTRDPDYADSSRILALSLDMNPVMHDFPYGKYQQGMNTTGPWLTPSGYQKSYKVTVDTTSILTITGLFKDAAEKRTFMWVPSVTIKSDLSKIKNVDKRLMKISVPIPNQIVTSDFLEKSSVVAEPGLLHRPVSDDTGAPAAFIFDYQKAKNLSVDYDSQFSMEGGPTSASDYHFRVVPKDCPPSYHATMMFANLMHHLVEWNNAEPVLEMSIPEKIDHGKYVPSGVTDEELDIPNSSQPCTRSMRTGACAGGGGGISTGP
jgi:hypothetical protein